MATLHIQPPSRKTPS